MLICVAWTQEGRWKGDGELDVPIGCVVIAIPPRQATGGNEQSLTSIVDDIQGPIGVRREVCTEGRHDAAS